MARQTLEKSIKFKGLIQALGIPRPCVRGLLETMWDVAHECGNPKLGTPRQVELAAEWYGEPGVFFAALADLEWIDEIDGSPGRWEIHDYWDHAPKSAAGRAQREAERELKGTTLSELRAEAGRRGGLAKASKSVASGSKLPENSSKSWQTPSKRDHSRHPTPDTGITTSEGVAVDPVPVELPREVSALSAPSPPRERARRVSPEMPPIPEELDTPEFRAAWAGRVQEREGRGAKHRLTGPQIVAQFRQLSAVVREHGIAAAVECVEAATAAGWQGIVFKDRLPGANSRSNGKGGHKLGAFGVTAGVMLAERREMGRNPEMDKELEEDRLRMLAIRERADRAREERDRATA